MLLHYSQVTITQTSLSQHSHIKPKNHPKTPTRNSYITQKTNADHLKTVTPTSLSSLIHHSHSTPATLAHPSQPQHSHNTTPTQNPITSLSHHPHFTHITLSSLLSRHSPESLTSPAHHSHATLKPLSVSHHSHITHTSPLTKHITSHSHVVLTLPIIHTSLSRKLSHYSQKPSTPHTLSRKTHNTLKPDVSYTNISLKTTLKNLKKQSHIIFIPLTSLSSHSHITPTTTVPSHHSHTNLHYSYNTLKLLSHYSHITQASLSQQVLIKLRSPKNHPHVTHTTPKQTHVTHYSHTNNITLISLSQYSCNTCTSVSLNDSPLTSLSEHCHISLTSLSHMHSDNAQASLSHTVTNAPISLDHITLTSFPLTHITLWSYLTVNSCVPHVTHTSFSHHSHNTLSLIYLSYHSSNIALTTFSHQP